MRIALFSDVHANLPALLSFFEDVERENIDAWYCLGDLVGYAPWPNEVIHEIRKRKIPTIAGNYDVGVGLNSDDCGCAYKTDEERHQGAQSIAFTNANVGDEERKYLRQLPQHFALDLPFADGMKRLLLVHGSPRKVNEYLFADREEKSMIRIFQQGGCDVLCFGHTHVPYHRNLVSDDKTFHAINLGSIGKPKDGDPRGGYVILHFDFTLPFQNPQSLKVTFKRFEYPVELTAAAIRQTELPDIFAEKLLKAF
jgi:predicted phosphodiesterase